MNSPFDKIIELVQKRHGVGTRSEHTPAWMQLRLERALDSMARVAGTSAVELARRLPEDGQALAELADVLRVGETSFFRDPAQWDALRELLPRFAEGGRLRALSVGCSTGEEAWTLAMLVEEAVSARSVESRGAKVVGMDRSELALVTAREAAYPADVVRRVPADLRRRFLQSDGDTCRVCDALRARVGFVRRDLMDGTPPGAYELIVCKNVLIYFGDEAFDVAARRLIGALSEGGILAVARSEVPRLRGLATAVDLSDGVTVFSA